MTTSRPPRPAFTAAESLIRMEKMEGVDMPYVLGTGDYLPSHGVDLPWTQRIKDKMIGGDCAGVAMSWAEGIARHRPGLNRGPWSTVSDDLNTNSGIEDAEHEGDLYTLVIGDDLQPGDLLCYPTIMLRNADDTDWLRDPHGEILKWIGHVQMLAKAPPTGWHRGKNRWRELEILHCHGGDGRRPAVTRGPAIAMDDHDANWPKPQHCVKVLRVKL